MAKSGVSIETFLLKSAVVDDVIEIYPGAVVAAVEGVHWRQRASSTATNEDVEVNAAARLSLEPHAGTDVQHADPLVMTALEPRVSTKHI